MSDWTPPVYKWLLTTLLPNDCLVYAIFDTREQAVGHADEIMDIEPHLWRENASEELRCHRDGYFYHITQEIYYPLSPGDREHHRNKNE